MRADIRNLRRALGNPKPPKVITQEPYEGNPRHLRRLARGDWRNELPSSSDLFAYIEDINFCEVVQPDLFRYMLPVLLEMWRRDLMRRTLSGDGNVEWFYNGLARRGYVRKLLGDRADQAAGAFMRDAILDRIDEMSDLVTVGNTLSPYNWIGALASLGVILPVVESLWREWWRLETPGQARALLQYASVLIYGDDDNPLFSPWTPEEGGGPALLWELEGHIYEKCWLPENVGFLRNVLTADYVEDGVWRAADKLRGTESDELLDRLIEDLSRQRPVLNRRVAALPGIFAEHIHHYFSWGDAGL